LIHLSRETPTGMRAPFFFTLIVRPEQVIDPVGLAAAVNAVKPAWQQWALVDSDGTLWDEDNQIWSTDTHTWDSGG
jgi:hypothetical protein